MSNSGWDSNPISASNGWDTARNATSNDWTSTPNPITTSSPSHPTPTAPPRGAVCGHPVPAANMRHCSRCWRQRLGAAHRKLRDACDVAAQALGDADRQDRRDARAALARHGGGGPEARAGSNCACEHCRRILGEYREATRGRAEAERRLTDAVDKLFDYRVRAWEDLFQERWAPTEMEFQDDAV